MTQLFWWQSLRSAPIAPRSPPPQLQASCESQSLSFISDQLHVPSQIHRFYCLSLGWQHWSCDRLPAWRLDTSQPCKRSLVCAACQFCSHIPRSSRLSPPLPCLLVLICTCCCRGSIRDHQILLVGTVRSGYIKEIRRDQPLERDRLWLTSSETGGGPHWKNKGEITIYKTFIFHRRVSLNSFKLSPSHIQ